MPVEFWQFIREQGFTIFVLCVGGVAIWQAWRADTKSAYDQRERNIEALGGLSSKIEAVNASVAELARMIMSLIQPK